MLALGKEHTQRYEEIFRSSFVTRFEIFQLSRIIVQSFFEEVFFNNLSHQTTVGGLSLSSTNVREKNCQSLKNDSFLSSCGRAEKKYTQA